MTINGNSGIKAARGEPHLTDAAETAVLRPQLLRFHAIAAGLTTLAVLIQAVLAGRGQFIDRTFLDIHGYVANGLFPLVLAQAALAVLSGIRGRLRMPVLGLNLLLLVLVFSQIGLGYAGRENTTAASIHLPLGVLIFGLCVSAMSLAARVRRGSP
jgi:hypothetical protein